MRKKTCCCHYMSYSLRLASQGPFYAPSYRQDNWYHGFVTPVMEHWLEHEIAQWVHHKGSIRLPIAPWVETLTMELHLTPPSQQITGVFSHDQGNIIYGYMTSDIGQRTTPITRHKICCCHFMGYSVLLAARDLLYAPSHRV